MIDLGTCQPFASGYNRHCFRHPDDPSLCLKVLRPENIEARYQRQPWAKKLLGRRRIDDNAQELKAHRPKGHPPLALSRRSRDGLAASAPFLRG